MTVGTSPCRRRRLMSKLSSFDENHQGRHQQLSKYEYYREGQVSIQPAPERRRQAMTKKQQNHQGNGVKRVSFTHYSSHSFFGRCQLMMAMLTLLLSTYSIFHHSTNSIAIADAAMTPKPMMMTVTTTAATKMASTTETGAANSRLGLPNGRPTPSSLWLKSSDMFLSDLSTMRGGASKVEADEDDEEEEDSDDEEEDGNDEDEDYVDDVDALAGALGDESDESDFHEDNMVERWIAAFQKSPPLTKAYIQASFFVTLIGYVTKKKGSSQHGDFPPLLALDWEKTLKRGQFWRPFTCFLNLGSFGLNFALTAHFVWTYMSTLEKMYHREPYNFWIMFGFGMICMVVVYPLLKLPAKFLGHNLSTYIVYIWSRHHEGTDVNMFELFITRAELLPWFFLAQTFLLEGEFPILDLLGIVFGHVYQHCKTVGWLRAPKFVANWYKSSTSPLATSIRSRYKTISKEFEHREE